MKRAAPRYVAIANPDGLRWQAYAAELRAVWGEALDLTVIPWAAVILREGNLDAFEAFDRPAIVRLESPGRDWGVAQQFLHAGDGDSAWLNLPHDKGRLVAPRTFHRGFVHVLEGLNRSLMARPHLRPTAHPLAIATMFDKNATCARLGAAGVPIPETWENAPDDWDEVEHRLRAHSRWPVAYVKLNTGSSASGIAVVRALGDAPEAISSVVPIDEHFYSTRRLARHTGERLRRVVDFLCGQGVCVQRGVRMARVDGRNFDVRVVVLYGRPAFTIFRLSHLPMTNLHLGGKRGDAAQCRAVIPPRHWLDGLDAAVEAAGLFDSAMCGVDLLFEEGTLRPFILEVNAFGDFFPNLCDEQGRPVHRVEIEETARRVWDTL